MPKRPAPTKMSAMKTLYAAFEALIENNDELPRKELIEKITSKVIFEKWEEERYESNGQLKWLTIFLFYSIDCMKAGWITKNKGIWYITEEGKNAYKLGKEQLLEKAGIAYREWRSSNDKTKDSKTQETEDIDVTDTQIQQATIDELTAQANDGIGKYLDTIDEYKFQDLCAALIRVMGYHIDFIAPRGKDGGIDIVAYKDPLGFEKPRLKIQVKKRIETNKNNTDEIKILKSVLHKGEDIGIFITGSTFTKDARTFARLSDIHIKLIDRTDLIDLWKSNYHKFTDAEKSLLPLKPIYFLGSNE